MMKEPEIKNKLMTNNSGNPDYLESVVSILTGLSKKLKEEFEVSSLSIFGSVARRQNNEASDIDIFVEMPPKGLKFISLRLYLEENLNNKIDLIRRHVSIDKSFFKEIERDAVKVF